MSEAPEDNPTEAENETPISAEQAAEGEESQEDTEKGVSESTENGQAARPKPAREVPVSTVVRLMGLPTSSDLSVLESKIDSMSSKLTSAVYKIDRMSQQLQTLFQDSDRANTQVAELRDFMKKALAAAFTKLPDDVPASEPKKEEQSANEPSVLSSE